MDILELQNQIGKWQTEVWGIGGKEKTYALLRHLEEEVYELMLELWEEDEKYSYEKVGEELADVLIMALGIANRLNIDMGLEICRKMEINKKRKWERPDRCGMVRRNEYVLDENSGISDRILGSDLKT